MKFDKIDLILGDFQRLAEHHIRNAYGQECPCPHHTVPRITLELYGLVCDRLTAYAEAEVEDLRRDIYFSRQKLGELKAKLTETSEELYHWERDLRGREILDFGPEGVKRIKKPEELEWLTGQISGLAAEEAKVKAEIKELEQYLGYCEGRLRDIGEKL